MDLVYASERHYNGGPPVLEAATDKQAFKKTLFKASRRLQNVGIASNPLVIANARVPIIKFEDRVTGIAVDISFENLSGVQAQATFDQWKRDYPDMIYMVALVKQLLVMRGLNEVHTGGLGGFSIICLIVSYIQNSKKADNLGECFVGFLEYYGKNFDLSRKRIQMHPPGVIEKVGSCPNCLAKTRARTYKLTFRRQHMVLTAGKSKRQDCLSRIPTGLTTTYPVALEGPLMLSRSFRQPMIL
jgi:non-canonical poly(A) RNA polymerase PAPD5/7